jgi:hypothetical protein
MADIQPNKALYYPHLTFQSAGWVKGALLYWDGLVRMLGQVQPDDDAEIRELVEAGLIETIPLSPFSVEMRQQFGKRFGDLLRQRQGFPDAIPRVHDLRGRRPELVAMLVQNLAQALESQDRRRAAEVVRAMPDQAIALASGLMGHLVASERGLAPITDDPVFSAIATYFTADDVTSDPKAAPNGLAEADLRVPAPSPEALASLPVPRLLEIRDKLGNQRREFRRKVEAHRAAIAELPNVEAVRDQVKSFAADIHDDLEAQREAMEKANFRHNWSFLSVTAPASLAVGMTIAGSASPILGPVAGAGAVALGVSNWYVQRRKGERSSSNYVLSLQTELGHKGRHLKSGLDQLLSR